MNPLDNVLDLGDYLEIVRRRKFSFLVPFVLVVTIAVVIAFVLPPMYRSEATFLVQRQSVPQNLVATTVNSFVEEQIEQIRQRLVTWSNLEEIANQLGLYQAELQEDPEAAIRRLRENVEVEMVEVRASDPDRRTNEAITTIAFTVAFSAPTAKAAQDGTNALAERFLAEHEARRESQAEEVSKFLGEQAAMMEEEIAELEKKLADFKQVEFRQLPELMGTNLRLYETTEQDIDATEERIRGLQERIDVASAELSLTPAYDTVVDESGDRILTGSQRLSMLTAEYFRASARYSSQHPDIIRLRREIRVLTEQLGRDENRADEMLEELVRMQDALRDARLKYSDDHPEVRRLEQSVSSIQRTFQARVSEVVASSVEQSAPDNPRYVALKTQLDSNQVALRAEQQKLADLKARLAEYEDRLYQTPAVERDFRAITRAYETTLAQYAEIKEKQRQAELAQNLESGDSGEKFLLTSRGFLPTLPASPNRIGIGLLGVFLGMTIAIGCVAITEHLDRTIRSARMVTASIGIPPLVVIPRIWRT